MSDELPIFEVTVSREDNLWVAVVADLPGGATDVERFEDLSDAVRDLISTLTEIEPGNYWVSWRYRQGSYELTELLREFRQWEQQAEVATANRAAARNAAIVAMRRAGLSYRDIADVMGLSHQRVAQIVDKGDRGVDFHAGGIAFQAKWPVERRSNLFRELRNKITHGEPLHLKPTEASLLLILDSALDVSPSDRRDWLSLMAGVLEAAAADQDFIKRGDPANMRMPAAGS